MKKTSKYANPLDLTIREAFFHALATADDPLRLIRLLLGEDDVFAGAKRILERSDGVLVHTKDVGV